MSGRWIWLSHPLTETMPAYGDGDKPSLKPDKSMTAGDSCNTSRWSFPNHVGTHVDAPRHFFPDGLAISDFPADFWVFRHPCWVALPLDGNGFMIDAEKVPWEAIPPRTDLLLLKTGFGASYGTKRYWSDGPGLAPELAGRLRSACPDLRAVGFDFISVSSWRHREVGRQAHRAFLDPAARPLLLIEDMNLTGLKPGEPLKRVIVAPLRVAEADGSPCTVFAEVKL